LKSFYNDDFKLNPTNVIVSYNGLVYYVLDPHHKKYLKRNIFIYIIKTFIVIYKNVFSAPITSPWESRRIKQELINARAEIASLQERNKTLFNLKKESDILFEKEKSALEHNINKSKLTV